MPDHHFNPVLAQEYGVDVAIFLHNIYFWVERNRAYKKHFHEGRYWTYNSLVAFSEAHPYWSRRQIERIVAACKKNGLVLTGCFNVDSRDRTTWYALSDRALLYFSDSTPKVDDCISPNGEMQSQDAGHTYHETGSPLPDNSPDNSQTDSSLPAQQGGEPPKAKSPKSKPKYRPDWFDWFWTRYPRHTDRKAAVKAWDKLKPDKELCRVMKTAIELQRRTEQWQQGESYIPYFSTWLNGARWEDEVTPAATPGGWAPDPEVY